jgi:hypothetical protein
MSTGPAGRIEAVMVSVKHGQPMAPRDEVLAVEGRGLKGCRHARPRSKRQVLVCDRAVLAELGLATGQLKENLTVAGLEIDALTAGTRLACGAEAILEITEPCEPCKSMEAIRPGLKKTLAKRRGVLCRVIAGGVIRPGDSIRVVLAET